MFNSEFVEVGANAIDFYPDKLRDDINEINKLVYDNVNNGVYRCGFSTGCL